MLDMVLEGRTHDLGEGLIVHRMLPSPQRAAVGPFVFVDHAGPLDVWSNEMRKADVRPHPHIGLATISYLLEGMVTHRDSLGYEQILRPGDVNWMVAGRGITHSERFDNPGESPVRGLELIQTWVALPESEEDRPASFEHHTAASLPVFETDGVRATILVGEAYGQRSAATTFSPMFYVHVAMKTGAVLDLPDGYPERAAYVARGALRVEERDVHPYQMLIFAPDQPARIRAEQDSVVMLLGGAPLGERILWWNLVATDQERINEVKTEWKEGRIPLPPGETEFIPLPKDR